MGKISSQKSTKTRFLYSHEYRDQKRGGKYARNHFASNTRRVRAINVGKKSFEKSAKKRFLYSHEYRDQKKGGKNERNNFSRKTRIERA